MLLKQFSVVSTPEGAFLTIDHKHIGIFDTTEEAWAAFRGIKEFVRMFSLDMNSVIERDRLGKIRLWKLGSLEHNIIPSKEAFEKFMEALSNVPDDGTPADIVWNPAVSCEIIN